MSCTQGCYHTAIYQMFSIIYATPYPLIPNFSSSVLPPELPPYSFQSSNLNSSAPSKIVNRCVENTMLSYSSLPAALAFLCHGPKPPWNASSRECQKPTPSLIRRSNKYNRKLTSRQIPPLPIPLAEPILQQAPTLTRLRMALIVQFIQPIVVNTVFQLTPEHNDV